jgi:hypothetical protein
LAIKARGTSIAEKISDIRRFFDNRVILTEKERGVVRIETIYGAKPYLCREMSGIIWIFSYVPYWISGIHSNDKEK